MIGEAAAENVRRYRAIASLCRQTAGFRPAQRSSLLQQAEDWERLALIELEPCFERHEDEEQETDAPLEALADTRWWLPRREGLFVNLKG